MLRTIPRAVALAAGLTLAASLMTAPTQAAPPPAPRQAPAAAEVAGADDRPNVVLISSDDQTDTELAYMPLTRRLLGEAGIEFTDGINPHPLCCPARAEILTGEYGHNNGVHHNAGPWGGYQAFVDHGNLDDNLAVWMAEAGYRTGFVGKPMNGTTARSPRMGGWDYYSPTVANTYSYYGTTFLDDRTGSPRTYEDQYVADVVRDQTIGMIEEWAGQDEPFFVWASHVGPHGAVNAGSYVEAPGPSPRRLSAEVGGRAAPVPAVRHTDTFDDLALPTRSKPSFYETGAEVADKPAEVVRRSKVRAGLEELFQRRVESLQAIDEANAATIAALEATGELDDTVIVYVSDNGYQLGEHGLEGKSYPYAENLQIPFLMRAPDLAAGQQLDLSASLVDLAPTFLDYAGALDRVRAQGRTDGLSLRDAVTEGMPNDTTLIQAGAPRTAWEWRGVRTPRYTFATWTDGAKELYDRRKDPFELQNILDVDTGRLTDQRYVGVLRELKSRYRLLRTCAGVEECENRSFGRTPRLSRAPRGR